MSAKRILHALTQHSSKSTNFMYKYVPEALVSPSEGIAYNYLDLAKQVTDTSKGLLQSGYGPNTRIAACLPNLSSNVILQLSCAITGTTLITNKIPEELDDVAKSFDCKGIYDYHLTMSAGQKSGISSKDIHTATGNEEFAYYNAGKKETTLDSLMALADTTAKHFNMNEEDTICVPVSLNHTMGMAFGILPALLSGSTVVLPSGTPDPELLVNALRDQQATLFVGDTHLVKAVNELGADEKLAKYALRGGLIKIGSGEIISTEETRDVLGVTFDTVGIAK